MSPDQRKAMHAALDHAINTGAHISVMVHPEVAEDEHRILAHLYPEFDMDPWHTLDNDTHVRRTRAGNVSLDVFEARELNRIPNRDNLPEFQR